MTRRPGRGSERYTASLREMFQILARLSRADQDRALNAIHAVFALADAGIIGGSVEPEEKP